MICTKHSVFILLSLIPVLASADKPRSQSPTPAADDKAAKQSLLLSPQELFARVSRSVFIVEVTSQDGTSVTQGSGVAVGSDLIVTNKHAVIEGEKVIVIQGEKTWAARVSQLAPSLDMCLLVVPGLNVTSPPPIRPLGSLVVGERVYAIGAPQGFELTISDGLLSGVRQGENGPIIQTSAPISPGSSGGGLFDSAGYLIGITTFTLLESQQMNFAVPAQNVANLSQQPQHATAQAWVGAGDQFMNAARVNDLEPPPLDPEEQRIWTQRMEQEMRPVRIKWRKAIHAYREALVLEPQDPGIWVKLGTAYADLGEKSDATDALQRALASRRDDASVWLSVGDAYRQMDDRDGAIAAYCEAIQLRPNDASLWVTLAGAYPLDRKREIADALERAENLEPTDPSTWFGIGLQYESRLENYKQAATALREAVRLDPANSIYLFGLGELYAVRHDRSKARQVYQRLRVVDPNAADRLLGLIR